MTYFLMQLHFYIYTHYINIKSDLMENLIMPFVMGGIVGLALVSMFL